MNPEHSLCGICQSPVMKGQLYRESDGEIYHVEIVNCVKGVLAQLNTARRRIVELERQLADRGTKDSIK